MVYVRGRTFWVKYYRNGGPYGESSKSYKGTDTKRLLKIREVQKVFQIGTDIIQNYILEKTERGC